MRILVISDIHANIQALEAVVQDAGTVDEVWCAGDLVDYGTDPHGVLSWFRSHDVHCVSGNHDRHLLSVLESGETEQLRGTDRFKWVHDNCDRITSEDADYLINLPLQLTLWADGFVYLMQHQMDFGEMKYRMPESVEQFEAFWGHANVIRNKNQPRRMIFGHTHRRCVHQLDDNLLWLNPGSVSYRRPDDQDKRAHYMIIDGGRIELHAVPYDRGTSLCRVLEYARNGGMLLTDLQDTLFYFGDAQTTRDPVRIPPDT